MSQKPSGSLFDPDLMRADELRAQIRHHDDLYYNKSTPELSDDEYDRLFAELREIESRHPEWDLADSPTHKVGAVIPVAKSKKDAFQPFRHAVPMLSISNTYSAEEIRKFVGRVEGTLRNSGTAAFTVELKIDGVAFTAFYRDGALYRGATRGDGTTGEDVTANLKAIKAIPAKLTGKNIPAGEVEFRGEIYMPRKEFARLVKEQEESEADRVFANPRNATAGSLKLLDPNVVAARNLHCFFYQVIDPEEIGITGQSAAIAQLAQWGLPVNPLNKLCSTVDEILAFRDRIDTERHSLPYDTDGLVIKLDSFAQQQVLGLGARSPNWAVAYKFTPDRAETIVKDIRVQVGKLGRLTPVADLEPVFLSGSTITHASLHNESYIAEKDVRIHDRVLVEKAGEIIPQVYEVVKEKRPAEAKSYAMPHTCPACDHESVTTENKGPDGRISVLRFCPNPACPAKLFARIVHFASRDAMDIEGMGPAVVDWLLEHNVIKDVSSIYMLTRDKLLPMTKAGQALLSGVGNESEATKSVENLLNAIEASKKRGLAKLLFALSIPDVGETASQILARFFKALDALSQAAEDEISAVSMGESTSYRTLGNRSAKALRQKFDALTPDERPYGKDAGALEMYLKSLSLANFGAKKIEAVARTYHTIDKLLAASEEELALVEMGSSQIKRTLGPVAAASLRDYLDDPANRDMLDRLRQAGVSVNDTSAGGDGDGSGSKAANKVFVITGTLPTLGRPDAKRIIEKAGGLVAGTVSRKVDYLVVGESPGSKLDKAREMGVTVIDEAEMLALCNG